MENEGRLAAGGPGMPGGFWPRIGAGISRHSGGGGGAGDDPRHLAPDGGWGVPPDGRGVVPRKLGSLRGDILFESKEYPLALPKKDSGRDGVVTSSISFAAALRAPAHSFRCSSFSHRKRCAYFAVGTLYFPPRPSLKRPKGRGCGPLPLESRPGAGGSAWDGFPCGRFAGAGGVGEEGHYFYPFELCHCEEYSDVAIRSFVGGLVCTGVFGRPYRAALTQC